MKPSQVINAYRAGSRHAKMAGATCVISRTRLQGFGWTENKIDAVFHAIELIDDMERDCEAMCQELDQQFPK